MTLSDEQLAVYIEEIRNDDNYLSKTSSISERCTFKDVDVTQFDDVAVDKNTEVELELSMIGKIVRKTTFLTPSGSFIPTGIFPTKRHELNALLNTRLRASLVPADRDIPFLTQTLKDDWTQYNATLARMVRRTPDVAGEVRKVWCPYNKERGTVVLSHLLISKNLGSDEKEKNTISGSNMKEMLGFLTGEIDDDPINDAENEIGLVKQLNDRDEGHLDHILEVKIDKLHKIRSWPADLEWHKVADRFDHTHSINPLPAFDDNYDLIFPKSYESKLLGATVHARFTLSRFDIKGDQVFVANIVELQVLKPPPSGIATRKRKAFTERALEKKKKQRLI